MFLFVLFYVILGVRPSDSVISHTVSACEIRSKAPPPPRSKVLPVKSPPPNDKADKSPLGQKPLPVGSPPSSVKHVYATTLMSHLASSTAIFQSALVSVPSFIVGIDAACFSLRLYEL